jgi:hypothetical protein
VPSGRRAASDQLVAHAGDQEALEPAVPIGNPERGVARTGELSGTVDQPLQHLVHRQLGGHRQYSVADRLERGALPSVHVIEDKPATFASVPRHWFWTQVAIIGFVLAGIVIAITRLA